MVFKKYKQLIVGVVVGTIIASSGVALANAPVNFVNFKFKFNGTEKTVPEGYTVLEYQGRTYVPARFVAENMGGAVVWDANTKTVVVKSNIQLYSKIAHQYKILEDLGDWIIDIDYGFDTAFDEIDHYNRNDYLQKLHDDRINKVIDAYLETLKSTEAIISEAANEGIDVNDMKVILQNYLKALDNYKAAAQSLYDFSYNKTNANFDSFLEKRKAAFGFCLEGRKSSNTKYLEFYLKTQAN